jgi:hypothetical protein
VLFAQAHYHHSCSPRPLSHFVPVLCFAVLHLHLGVVVGSIPMWAVCRFVCCLRASGFLLGRGKALGMTLPGL